MKLFILSLVIFVISCAEISNASVSVHGASQAANTQGSNSTGVPDQVCGTSWANAAGLSVTITVSGKRPVFLLLQGSPQSYASTLGCNILLNGGAVLGYRFQRDGTLSFNHNQVTTNTGNTTIPCSSMSAIDESVPAGQHTYTFQMYGAGSSPCGQVVYGRLIAYEM